MTGHEQLLALGYSASSEKRYWNGDAVTLTQYLDKENNRITFVNEYYEIEASNEKTKVPLTLMISELRAIFQWMKDEGWPL